MNYKLVLILVEALCLLTAGCYSTAAKQDEAPKPPPVVKTESAEFFEACADSVDGQTVTKMSRLSKVVTIGNRNGWLSKDNVSAFDQAFGSVKERDLTHEDAEKLRGLK